MKWVVEIWDNESDFKNERKTDPDLIRKVGGKYITVWNVNDEQEIKTMIATFKFINN